MRHLHYLQVKRGPNEWKWVTLPPSPAAFSRPVPSPQPISERDVKRRTSRGTGWWGNWIWWVVHGQWVPALWSRGSSGVWWRLLWGFLPSTGISPLPPTPLPSSAPQSQRNLGSIEILVHGHHHSHRKFRFLISNQTLTVWCMNGDSMWAFFITGLVGMDEARNFVGKI